MQRIQVVFNTNDLKVWHAMTMDSFPYPKALGLSPGGWLHVHHNVLDTDEERWKEQTCHRLRGLSRDFGNDWTIELKNTERVKW